MSQHILQPQIPCIALEENICYNLGGHTGAPQQGCDEMKFKRFLIVLFMILFLFSTCFTAGAWTPDYKFNCTISPQGIPDGTVYIDLLLPISEKDECYTEFNEENGKQYSISSDSEIAKYNQDGYMSYTFHVSDAYSEMAPFYIYSFTLEADIYNRYHEKLGVLEKYRSTDLEGRSSYYIKTIDGSPLQQELDRIAETDAFKYWNTYYKEEKYTEYNPDFIDGEIRKSEYDFNYCCKKYSRAKMAYLNEKGDIIAVSSKARIKPYKRLNLSLSGEAFTSDIQSGPPIFLLIIFEIAVLITALIILIIFIIRTLIKRHQRRKQMKPFFDYIKDHTIK